MSRTSQRCSRIALVALLACGSSGCAVVGLKSAGSSVNPEGDEPVAFEQLEELPHGTPLRVLLAGGGSVRGFYLGTAPRDSAGRPVAPVLVLGTGNSLIVDLKFEAHEVLVEPTALQVPDTLRFTEGQIADMGVPVGLQHMPQEERILASAITGVSVPILIAEVTTAVVMLPVQAFKFLMGMLIK